MTNPEDALAAYNYGLLARKQHQEAQAIPVLEAASQVHQDDSRIWHVLALLYRGMDRMADALDAFARAVALAPQDGLIAHGYARTSMEAGRPATRLYNIAHNLSPGDGSILVGRSAAQLAEGEVANAISDLDAVLLRNPAWEEGHSALSSLRWMTGDHDQFTASVERGLQHTPNSPLLWKQLVITYFQAHKHREVLEAIDQARVSLRQADAFMILEACSLSELGELERADAAFSLLKDSEDSVQVEYRMRHLVRSGRYKEAVIFAKNYDNSPLSVVILPYLITTWRVLGDEQWEQYEADPTFVGVYDIPDLMPSTESLVKILGKLHTTEHEPLEQSLRGGTQTDGSLFSRLEPEIEKLREAMRMTVEEYITQLPPYKENHPLLGTTNRDVRFAGSWSVRLKKAGYHANHVHQAGWISSVLYISLPPPSEMGDAPAGWLVLGQPPAELGIDLPPHRSIEPKTGRLVLFPSTMWHGTVPFNAGERLTVAFDVAVPR